VGGVTTSRWVFSSIRQVGSGEEGGGAHLVLAISGSGSVLGVRWCNDLRGGATVFDGETLAPACAVGIPHQASLLTVIIGSGGRRGPHFLLGSPVALNTP
jgi:hypothetical protein